MWVTTDFLFKDLFRYLIDIFILFSVADGSLLKFGSFYSINCVIVARLEYLNHGDHLLVFEEVKRASIEVEGVPVDQLLDLFVKLFVHTLV